MLQCQVMFHLLGVLTSRSSPTCRRDVGDDAASAFSFIFQAVPLAACVNPLSRIEPRNMLLSSICFKRCDCLVHHAQRIAHASRIYGRRYALLERLSDASVVDGVVTGH